ncbi:MAG: iron-sulfur cluster assembly accessory protein [Alteromonadaceae bacterium]|nr:MAG: iron-sulfur cluster assembly accessory protein [Alteromonadaceae bacterium]
MTVESFGIEESITVTPAAAEHFSKTLQKSGQQGLRITLKESGCTGYKYIIDEIESPQEGDIKLALANDVDMYVDASYLPQLSGMVIDYIQEGLNRNLVLNNPNVKDACGCGESVGF